jgi:hypothetical protein
MWDTLIPYSGRPILRRDYLIPLLAVISMVTTTLPPQKSRIFITLPILLYVYLQIPRYGAGNIAADYMLAINGSVAILKYLDFVVFHTPERDMWRISERGRRGTAKEGDERLALEEEKLKACPDSIAGKAAWSWSLWSTNRGVGWNWRAKGVRKAVPLDYSKWKFVGENLALFCWNFLVFDAGGYFLRFSTPYGNPISRPQFLKTDHQLLLSWIEGFRVYSSLNMQYNFFAAVTVALGLYTPQMWPPLMGKLKEVHSVRDFWSFFWHQMMRRVGSHINGCGSVGNADYVVVDHFPF